ncbi:phosphopantetheine-binding protein [uncultured Bacteroides sp.]|uniref:acyl carrier protein n=1 Tax=uncultured Bacteroides sp. TaxID=162156 RepID=UPI002AAB1F03|nr:phosphopantetheine-binding protein [uncultured Bacteroides sp.]
MDFNKFTENLANLFDETDSDEFTAETRFKELEEWSSLVALSIIVMIDEKYQVRIKADDIRYSQTINDLYEIVLLNLD